MQLVNPLAGVVTSPYDLARIHPLHRTRIPHYGTDVGGRPRGGTHWIHAAAGGTVVAARSDSYPGDARLAGRYVTRLTGNYVVLDHGGGLRTYYGHLARVTVTARQKVTAGQRIGTQGATGQVSGAHLHLEVWRNGTPIDPEPFFRARHAPLGTGPTTPPEPEDDMPLTDSEKREIKGWVDTAAENVHEGLQNDIKALVPGMVAKALREQIPAIAHAVQGYRNPRLETVDSYQIMRDTRDHAAAIREQLDGKEAQ